MPEANMSTIAETILPSLSNPTGTCAQHLIKCNVHICDSEQEIRAERTKRYLWFICWVEPHRAIGLLTDLRGSSTRHERTSLPVHL